MDETILLWVNSHYNDFWDAFMPLLTHRFMWIPMYIALAYAIMRTLGWKRGLMVIIAIALTTLVADQVSSHVIRPWAQRLRPSNLDNPLSQYIHIVDGYRGAPYGMPSSHAANTVGLLTMLALRFKNKTLIATITIWMLMQVYSRMYLGVHYPTDLLVGAIVGCLSALTIYTLLYYISKAPQSPKGESLKFVWGGEFLQYERVPELTFVLTLLVITIICCI